MKRLFIRSCGYEHEPLPKATFTFDCRVLENPYWIKELSPFCGKNPQIKAFLDKSPKTKPFLDEILRQIEECQEEEISIVCFCTGGYHRSVYVAAYLASYYLNKASVSLSHRDLGKGIKPCK